MWGLYWRYLISLFLLLFVSALLSNQLDYLNDENYLNLRPTFVWASFAIFFTFVSLIKKNGFAYIFLGRRLCLCDDIWKKFNVILISFFVALSILNYVVHYVVHFVVEIEIWKLYKLFGQTFLLIIFPLFSAWYVVRPLKT